MTAISAKGFRLTEPRDWELLRLSVGEDSSRFDELVERHYRGAIAFCRQVLGDHQRAEDVVQRGFANIYRTRARHDERARFRTFLYRVLLNLCINELARKPGPMLMSDMSGDGEGTPAFVDRRSPDPAREVERAELRGVIGAAIARLNPKHRAALYLREYEGMAYDEIAAALEATMAEVKIWIHRARRRLVDILRPYMDRGEVPA